MNHRKPPLLARWMLDHLIPRETNEALSGDLLETFRTGRSPGWYWYQVIAAIAIAWSRNAWRHRTTLFFAAVWSVFSPAWILILTITHSSVSILADKISAVPWPWSFICGFVFTMMGPSMLFIWLGVAVYSTLRLLIFGKFPLRWAWKGFLWGLVAFALAQACKIAIDVHYPHTASHAEHWGSLTVLGVIENFGSWSALLRFPYFIGTATALWFLPSGHRSEKSTAS
jgi:hypothetical protein